MIRLRRGRPRLLGQMRIAPAPAVGGMAAGDVGQERTDFRFAAGLKPLLLQKPEQFVQQEPAEGKRLRRVLPDSEVVTEFVKESAGFKSNFADHSQNWWTVQDSNL